VAAAILARSRQPVDFELEHSVRCYVFSATVRNRLESPPEPQLAIMDCSSLTREEVYNSTEFILREIAKSTNISPIHRTTTQCPRPVKTMAQHRTAPKMPDLTYFQKVMGRKYMEYSQPPRVAGNEKPQLVFWITNLAAPYRVPVWTEIAKRHVLTIGLLESNSSLSADDNANRGSDWQHSPDAGVHYIEIPTWKFSRGEARYYVLRNLSTIQRIRKSDVILFGGWESPAYWAVLVIAAWFRVRRVGFYESTINTMRHRSGPVAWIRRAFFRSMHAVVTPGPAASVSLESMGVASGRIVEGFNAVDVRAFHETATRLRANRVDNPDGGHSFLYVGQLISRKRVHAIVEAFSEVGRPEDKLTIVGAGELECELRESSRSLGDRIAILPTVDNGAMPAVMAEHHTLVLASSTEVWGLVVNEALATGMHVVVSNNCGVAPSVGGMRGVYLTRADLGDLGAKMLASKKEWTGRISSPAILDHTPDRFSECFLTAFNLARPSSGTLCGAQGSP
jgi:glycosyltransferase involved in cell wall biosynthesis